MKPDSTFKISKKFFGSLVCVFCVSGFATNHAIQLVEARLSVPTTPAKVVSNLMALEETTDTFVQNSDEESTMPPAPDMGAIFAAQRAEETARNPEAFLANVDYRTTGSIPTSKVTSLTTKLSQSVDPTTTAIISTNPKVAALIKNVPIPVPSPNRPRQKQVERPLKKSRAGTPDVLVLGDSQISVSAGPTYQQFFSNLPAICNANKASSPALANIDFTRTASLGVRSTSLHSWVARSGRAKGSICDVDKKWGINAGAWGIGGNSKRNYIQIGKGKDYQFCKPKKSAFESMFAKGYYKPKLLVMAFLGNSADRWARSKKNALRDARSTLAQIPKDTACIFMTTAPVYSKKVNRLRMKAQKNIAAAFAELGNRCSVVKGFTPRVRARIEGNKAFFRKTKSGRIADKFHPNASAIKLFVKQNTASLCKAFKEQVR